MKKQSWRKSGHLLFCCDKLAENERQKSTRTQTHNIYSTNSFTLWAYVAFTQYLPLSLTDTHTHTYTPSCTHTCCRLMLFAHCPPAGGNCSFIIKTTNKWASTWRSSPQRLTIETWAEQTKMSWGGEEVTAILGGSTYQSWTGSLVEPRQHNNNRLLLLGHQVQVGHNMQPVR